MTVISSQDNRIYRQCIQLGQKKYRDRLGLYIAEGRKLVQEALDAGKARTVLLREDVSPPFSEDTAFLFMKGNLFDRIAQTETSQGILAVVAAQDEDAGRFLESISGAGRHVLLLDRLQDPGNIGTLIRTADAAGYAGLLVLKGTGDIYAPKVVRAAAGSLLRLPVYRADSEEEALDLLRKAGKRLVAATPEGGTDYRLVDYSPGIGLMVGNEGAGLSASLEARADLRVLIPMANGVESLNAAVAAGILIYESIKKGAPSCRNN